MNTSITPPPNPDEQESNGIVIIWAIIIFAILFSSCDNSIEKFERNRSEFFGEPKFLSEYKIDESTIVKSYIIDSCEYVGYLAATMSKVNYLTHKGNCRFCAKRDTIK